MTVSPAAIQAPGVMLPRAVHEFHSQTQLSKRPPSPWNCSAIPSA